MLGGERSRRTRTVYDADASTLCRLVALALAPTVAILWFAARQLGLDGSRKAEPDRVVPKRGVKSARAVDVDEAAPRHRRAA
jgi:hypothetical protein